MRPLTRLALAALSASPLLACSPQEFVLRTVSEDGRTPVAGIRVQLDDGEWQTTGADGTLRQVGHVPLVIRVHQRWTRTASGGVQRVTDDVWVLRLDSLTLRLASDGVRELAVDSGGVTQSRGPLSVTATGGAAGRTTLYIPGRDVRLDSAQKYSSSDFLWEGADGQRYTAHVLTTDDAVPPTRYLGYGKADITFRTAGTEATIALSPVSEARVTGSVRTALASPTSLTTALRLGFPEHEVQLGARSGASATAVDAVFPQVAGLTAALSSVATDAEGGSGLHYRQVALPSTGVQLDVPAPAVAEAPAAGATVGADTPFSWQAVPGAQRYRLLVSCTHETATAQQHVNYRALETTGTSLTLPAIPGLTPNPGSTCDWNVQAVLTDTEQERRVASSARRTFTLR